MKLKTKIDDAAFKSVLNKIKDIQDPISSSVAKSIAASVVSEMKRLIATGKSTIAGRGNFGAYRGEYRRRIQKYGYVYSEGDKYSKQLKPVNLKVSGKFLDSLRSLSQKTKSGYAAVIGFTTKRSNLLETGHRDGANGQAERPIIPQEGERFVTTIQQLYLSIINEAISKIAKRK